MRSDTVDISIIVAVYNHEKYIEKAIQSILMQKGDYSYEVLIGEDCSTDNTRKVLKKMEPSLPAQFHIFYREKNMGAMGENNFNDLYSRSRGKYYIVLEGDDYWTYEYKLQKQFEFLESHPDYLAVAHNTEVVDENNMPLGWDYPECKHTEYTIYDFRKDLLPGQTTTILMRNYFANDLFDWHLEPSNFPGDRKKPLYLSPMDILLAFNKNGVRIDSWYRMDPVFRQQLTINLSITKELMTIFIVFIYMR